MRNSTVSFTPSRLVTEEQRTLDWLWPAVSPISLDAVAGSEVIVHVYDLGKSAWTTSLNNYWWRVGMFHTGVEVFGTEWFFGVTFDDEDPGVAHCRPKQNPDHTYRESVSMGCTDSSEDEVYEILSKLRQKWLGSTYSVFSRNCHNFTDFFCCLLGVGHGPNWLNGILGKLHDDPTAPAEPMQKPAPPMLCSPQNTGSRARVPILTASSSETGLVSIAMSGIRLAFEKVQVCRFPERRADRNEKVVVTMRPGPPVGDSNGFCSDSDAVASESCSDPWSVSRSSMLPLRTVQLRPIRDFQPSPQPLVTAEAFREAPPEFDRLCESPLDSESSTGSSDENCLVHQSIFDGTAIAKPFTKGRWGGIGGSSSSTAPSSENNLIPVEHCFPTIPADHVIYGCASSGRAGSGASSTASLHRDVHLGGVLAEINTVLRDELPESRGMLVASAGADVSCALSRTFVQCELMQIYGQAIRKVEARLAAHTYVAQLCDCLDESRASCRLHDEKQLELTSTGL